MAAQVKQRNYSITGEGKELMLQKGLDSADWYRCPIPRQRFKELAKRKNGPAIRDTLIWFALLIGLGYLAYLSWGTWWAIPAFFAYGTVYMTHAVSKWHEFGHGTAFKTPWMNEVMYWICALMIFIQAIHYRWTHTRHHTNTIIVGSDPEIVQPRPPVWRAIIFGHLRVNGIPGMLKSTMRRFFGRLTDSEKEVVPESEYKKLFWEARLFVFFYLGVIVLCIYTRSILPAMFVGLPIFYGSPLITMLTLTQHLGLNEDVLDHRLNTRTFYTNFFLRFLYSNMNYHLEHHMFPLIPYHALPALHEEIRKDCPPANPSFTHAAKETLIALWRQRKDQEYTITRPLPEGAGSYRYTPDMAQGGHHV